MFSVIKITSKQFNNVIYLVIICCLFFLWVLPYNVNAQESQTSLTRIKYTINEDWKFISHGLAFGQRQLTDDIAAQEISLPHTWNDQDPFDGR